MVLENPGSAGVPPASLWTYDPPSLSGRLPFVRAIEEQLIDSRGTVLIACRHEQKPLCPDASRRGDLVWRPAGELPRNDQRDGSAERGCSGLELFIHGNHQCSSASRSGGANSKKRL